MVNAQSILESQAQGEFKSILFVNQVRTAGVILTKMDVQTTYKLCFRCSRYRWKAKKISLPIQLVPLQNMLGGDGNHHNKKMSRICQKSVTHVSWPKDLVHPRDA
jgi:tRNA splicing ligase